MVISPFDRVHNMTFYSSLSLSRSLSCVRFVKRSTMLIVYQRPLGSLKCTVLARWPAPSLKGKRGRQIRSTEMVEVTLSLFFFLSCSIFRSKSCLLSSSGERRLETNHQK